jgi:hypothetical protein
MGDVLLIVANDFHSYPMTDDARDAVSLQMLAYLLYYLPTAKVVQLR